MENDMEITGGLCGVVTFGACRRNCEDFSSRRVKRES